MRFTSKKEREFSLAGLAVQAAVCCCYIRDGCAFFRTFVSAAVQTVLHMRRLCVFSYAVHFTQKEKRTMRTIEKTMQLYIINSFIFRHR